MNAFRSAVQIKNYPLMFAQGVPHDKFKRCEMSFDGGPFETYVCHTVSTKRSKRDPVLLLLFE